jgi:hypothetical protein
MKVARGEGQTRCNGVCNSLQFVNVSPGTLGSKYQRLALGADVSAAHDTRRNKRKPFESVALVDLCDGEQPRPCQVCDISHGGARLIVFGDTSTIPDTFNLLLDPSARVQRFCKVAWRTETELGVQFLKPTA